MIKASSISSPSSVAGHPWPGPKLGLLQQRTSHTREHRVEKVQTWSEILFCSSWFGYDLPCVTSSFFFNSRLIPGNQTFVFGCDQHENVGCSLNFYDYHDPRHSQVHVNVIRHCTCPEERCNTHNFYLKMSAIAQNVSQSETLIKEVVLRWRWRKMWVKKLIVYVFRNKTSNAPPGSVTTSDDLVDDVHKNESPKTTTAASTSTISDLLANSPAFVHPSWVSSGYFGSCAGSEFDHSVEYKLKTYHRQGKIQELLLATMKNKNHIIGGLRLGYHGFHLGWYGCVYGNCNSAKDYIVHSCVIAGGRVTEIFGADSQPTLLLLIIILKIALQVLIWMMTSCSWDSSLKMEPFVVPLVPCTQLVPLTLEPWLPMVIVI